MGKLLATLNRPGEGALAVDIVMQSIDASIDVFMERLLAAGCDRRHNRAAPVFTSP